MSGMIERLKLTQLSGILRYKHPKVAVLSTLVAVAILAALGVVLNIYFNNLAMTITIPIGGALVGLGIGYAAALHVLHKEIVRLREAQVADGVVGKSSQNQLKDIREGSADPSFLLILSSEKQKYLQQYFTHIYIKPIETETKKDKEKKMDALGALSNIPGHTRVLIMTSNQWSRLNHLIRAKVSMIDVVNNEKNKQVLENPQLYDVTLFFINSSSPTFSGTDYPLPPLATEK